MRGWGWILEYRGSWDQAMDRAADRRAARKRAGGTKGPDDQGLELLGGEAGSSPRPSELHPEDNDSYWDE